MAVDFLYLATTEDNPHVKTVKLPKPDSEELTSLKNKTCSWIPYSYVSVSNPDEFSAETKEIIGKVEKGNRMGRICAL